MFGDRHGLTLYDHVTDKEIRERTGIAISVKGLTEAKKIDGDGHVERVKEDRWSKKLLNWISSQRETGGPRKNLNDDLRDHES